MGTLIILFIGIDPIINYLRCVLDQLKWQRAVVVRLKHTSLSKYGEMIRFQLEGCKKNKTVYDLAMTEEGHSKSATQCREKAKKLKTEY